MPFNYLRIASKVERIIRRFGMRALLRRSSGDRECFLIRIDYTPNERSDLILSTDWLAMVSTEGLTVAPDNEQDKLVLLNATGAEIEVLKIVTEPGRLQPAHDILYWELQVRPG